MYSKLIHKIKEQEVKNHKKREERTIKGTAGNVREGIAKSFQPASIGLT